MVVLNPLNEVDTKKKNKIESFEIDSSQVLVKAEAIELDEDSFYANNSVAEPMENRFNDDLGDISLTDRMWTKHYIGLYAQYAAVGLLYGMNGAVLNLCVYVYEGETNLCSNASNFIFLAWSFKIFYGIGTESFRPYGLRRKPYMIFGWVGALILLFALAVSAESLNASSWIAILMMIQFFAMMSDVPADGYSVELGKMEPKETRGTILAIGQRIRFTFCVVAGGIQAFLLNGPTTNKEDCTISFNQCWKWGLTVQQYYALIFCMVFILVLPIYIMKEPDASKIPRHTMKEFGAEIWITLSNLTTLYLIIYVVGIQILTNFYNNANILLQYYVIELTNFQAGLDTMSTYAALSFAIWIFQKYLLNRNWRKTKYASVAFSAGCSLLWIPAYYNSGGTRNAWYTIFVDLDQQFAAGISQVLYSMAVIEVSRVGQEATTYELIVSVGNAAGTVSGILSTQLLGSVNANGCDNEDPATCPDTTVALATTESFEDTGGPRKFTSYTIILVCITFVGTIIFTPFLPSSKDKCHYWKTLGEKAGLSDRRALYTLILSVVVVSYGILCAVLLLNDSTQCMTWIGGSGC
jgi:hypothetical protein